MQLWGREMLLIFEGWNTCMYDKIFPFYFSFFGVTLISRGVVEVALHPSTLNQS
jgi:hypothetical protein